VMWQSLRNVAHLDLPAAEVGSFRGGSAFFIASAIRALTGKEADLHIVDTFEGHPDDSIAEHDSETQRGKFANTSHEEVREYLSPFPGVTVHKGDARAILATWPESQFRFVHVDVDLFEATQECLGYFGPRLANGGVIVLDDYGAPSCPGVAMAAAQFLDAHPGFQTWNSRTEQLVLVKR
jgi:O-methyltransferase